jgi:hypothetical protein
MPALHLVRYVWISSTKDLVELNHPYRKYLYTAKAVHMIYRFLVHIITLDWPENHHTQSRHLLNVLCGIRHTSETALPLMAILVALLMDVALHEKFLQQSEIFKNRKGDYKER